MTGSGDALIGHTGFVGGNLDCQLPFAARYNSTNIEDIRGRIFETVYCAGAPGVKWLANREPEVDRAAIERLAASLAEARADHVILISTIDVYPEPRGVDEQTEIVPTDGHPYGRHRLWLERFVRERFDATVVRLPGLFGPGLRKNVIFDVLSDNMTDRIQTESAYQFYDLTSLAADIARVRAASLPLVNFATEPVRVHRLLDVAFGITLENPDAPPPASYDFRTRHAELLGGRGGYLMDATEVLDRCRRFVERSGWRRP